MTYVTDPIGDLLTRMRNAQKVGHDSCRTSFSKIKHQLCELLKNEKWISGVEVLGDAPKQEIEVTFSEEKPEMEIKRISKPGRRVYSGKSDLKPILRGYGIAVLTTSKGLMTDVQARKEGVGGEILCTIA